MKKIYLEQHAHITGAHYYVVMKLVNDVKYNLGQELTRAAVQELCDMPKTWHVVIEKYLRAVF